MKKSVKIIIAVVVIAVILIALLAGVYNGMVNAQANAETAFSNIETQLQRRFDLVPNLVETVKGASAHEQNVINSVTEARAKYAGAGSVSEKAEAAGEFSSALSRLMVVVENYPTITSTPSYIALQDELAGTENRINIARQDYNAAATEYNKLIRKFPNVIFAGMFGFDQMSLFEAANGAETAPQVSFQ
ncbi:MAG: LemA family protein [Clostridia bacterium]|nr:LemA family protein [Clostridia bacterium]MBR2972789.1 LemA family protein [Clostridia bacterium]